MILCLCVYVFVVFKNGGKGSETGFERVKKRRCHGVGFIPRMVVWRHNSWKGFTSRRKCASVSLSDTQNIGHPVHIHILPTPAAP